MKKTVVIIGASGHGKVVADIVNKRGDQVLGFLDDNPELSKAFIGLPVLGRVEDYEKYKNALFVVAIGDANIREKIVEALKDVNWYTAIHPAAVVSTLDTKIGEGTVIMANAVINPGAEVGNHCIINTGAIVEHDNKLADFVHISVGAKLAGSVTVGKGTWVGIGASISNNVTICTECMIGAGAVVVKDIVEMGTYVGVPVKKIEGETA